MQTILPASKQLFCRPLKAEKKTKSGFLLSGDAPKLPIAEVINSGSKLFAQGDKVLHTPYSAQEFKLNDQDYVMLSEMDILGTVLETE